jgi:hypothetical protein
MRLNKLSSLFLLTAFFSTAYAEDAPPLNDIRCLIVGMQMIFSVGRAVRTSMYSPGTGESGARARLALRISVSEAHRSVATSLSQIERESRLPDHNSFTGDLRSWCASTEPVRGRLPYPESVLFACSHAVFAATST